MSESRLVYSPSWATRIKLDPHILATFNIEVPIQTKIFSLNEKIISERIFLPCDFSWCRCKGSTGALITSLGTFKLQLINIRFIFLQQMFVRGVRKIGKKGLYMWRAINRYFMSFLLLFSICHLIQVQLKFTHVSDGNLFELLPKWVSSRREVVKLYQSYYFH